MLGPYAVLADVYRKQIQGGRTQDWEKVCSEIECDPPTPMAMDADLMPLVEVPEQQFQSWTEDACAVRRGDKVVVGGIEYLVRDVTDAIDLPGGRTTRRMHLVKLDK